MNGFYEDIVKELKQLLQDDENIYAAWEGGSAATGYLDEYSDLDLALITKDDYIDTAFEIIEKFLIANYGLKHRFRIPEPCWHSHSQVFYILENSPKYFYVDLLIEKDSNPNRFTESDRHGNSIIWFDKKSQVDGTPTPVNETTKRYMASYERIIDYFPFIYIDIGKQLERGNLIDALAIYNGLINRFILLKNIIYRPAKYDFGLRYLYRDFPKIDIDLIEKLMCAKTLTEINDNLVLIQNQVEVMKHKICIRHKKD